MSKQAGIYVRISADREGTSLGVKRQEEDARALAARRGWTVAEVYRDNDITGTGKRKRPGWERLMADLDAGRVNAVVAYSASRMYRNLRDLTRLLDLAKAGRVDIATVASGDLNLNTADGRMLATILAGVDVAEAERVGERRKRQIRQARADGRWTGGRRPFGYRPEDGRLVPDATEAALLRDLVTQALNGASLGSLVKRWNETGVRTTGGGRWSPYHLKLMLTRPNVGIISPRDTAALRKRWPKGESSSNGERRLLSGLLWCEVCGSRMQSRGPKYVCSGGDPRGTIHLTVRKGEVEEYVQQQAASAEMTEARIASDPAEPLVAERDRIEREMEALGESDLPDAVLRGRARKLERELKAVDEELARLGPVTAKGVDFEKLLGAPFGAQADTRVWLETLIEKVEVRPGRGEKNRALPVAERVTIRWAKGTKPPKKARRFRGRRASETSSPVPAVQPRASGTLLGP